MITITRAHFRGDQNPVIDTATASLVAALCTLVHDELLLRGANDAYRSPGSHLIVETIKGDERSTATFSGGDHEDMACLFDAVFFYGLAAGHAYAAFRGNDLHRHACTQLFEHQRHLVQPGYVDRFVMLMALGITNPQNHRAVVRIPAIEVIPILEFLVESPLSTIDDLLQACRITTVEK